MRAENSFIPVYGIGDTIEQKLWRAGVTTWNEFDDSVLGPKRTDRVREFIDEAKAELAAENAGFFNEAFPAGTHWRLYENFQRDACFVDIETTGLSKYQDRVTVVTLHHGDETTTLVRGMNLTPSRLREELADVKLLVTFNGKQFDIPFLAQEFNIEPSIPHIDLRFLCRNLGLGSQLESVESELGIPRSHTDVNGRDAIRLWYEYERDNTVDSLNKLVAYNREDTVNLKSILDVVSDQLHDEVFLSACEDQDK